MGLGGLIELENNGLDFGRDGRLRAMIGRNGSYGSLSVRGREYWMDVLTEDFIPRWMEASC